MTKQEKVAAFMLENKFEWLEEDQQWYKVLPHRVGDFQGKGRGQYMHPELATFFYDVVIEARRFGRQIGQYQAADKLYGDVCHIYMFGDNKDSAKAKSISDWSAVGLLKDCEAFMNTNSKAYKEYLRHLKQEGKTNE